MDCGNENHLIGTHVQPTHTPGSHFQAWVASRIGPQWRNTDTFERAKAYQGFSLQLIMADVLDFA